MKIKNISKRNIDIRQYFLGKGKTGEFPENVALSLISKRKAEKAEERKKFRVQNDSIDND